MGLISCDKGNTGCSGGWAKAALDYVIQKKGLVTETCYPYTATNTKCVIKSECKRLCQCKSEPKQCIGVSQMRECLTTGPVTAVMGVCESFFHYKAGIYSCNCNGNYLGLQSVTVFGYGDEPKSFFLAKNWWGKSWGEEGFFKIGQEECGIKGNYPNGNVMCACLLYTSDAADDTPCVDLGGRRIIKKKRT
eukprot:TRINITY_DN58544_c0_g1_i1.p2 TRINITY_DN58544_c0_g1~~TRINITY_DN58544_c0_g1_i1.p2  ORF type:complete len:191 (+),score=22.10 TRINITY_DN58544_c0_g1_i1:194-766(+)